jgi:DegV family protein with EDD domain
VKKIGIITDSHSGITQKMAQELGIMVLPMPFYFEDECFYEDVNLSREEFYDKLKNSTSVTTSQPSPDEVMKLWDKALEEYENIIYIPISSGLSGSCSTAMGFAQSDKYRGKVFVVDNGRVSTPQHRSVLDAIELVEEGYEAEEIKKILEKSRDRMVIYVAVDSLEYLKRGGRVSATTATIGNLLNVKPILKFDVGILDTFQKCRGFVKAKKAMIEAVKNDLVTKFKEEYERGEVYILAASSAIKEETDKWVEEIKAAFPNLDVMIDTLSMGVSCHIGPGGLGIGCSCKPQR